MTSNCSECAGPRVVNTVGRTAAGARDCSQGGPIADRSRCARPATGFVPFLTILLLGLVIPLLGPARAQETASEVRRPTAALAEVTGLIGPAAAHHVSNSIATARESNAEVLILQVNTPGGLVTSMREIVADILKSSVPVVGYVAPSGGRATSAGTYIVYSTHVAAMAPGTNMGAATPITIGGLPELPLRRGGPTDEADEQEPADRDAAQKTDESTSKPEPETPAEPEKAKAISDAVAFIRSLAEMRGRNVVWAERAVREAASITAEQAVQTGVVEILARDVTELLALLDGRIVTVGGIERRLATKGIAIELIEPTFMTEVLALLSNPNIAFLLMLIGAYGLIYEFANPGIGPGVVGVICLVLGLYALNHLPLNYAGLALLTLGVAFMAAEAFTPAFGILGIGGLVAFVIGAAMLVDTDIPEYQLSWTLIGTTAVLSGAVLTLLLGYVWRAQRRPVRSGMETEIGTVGEVVDWQDGEGHVWVHGERWNASGPQALTTGDRVRVDAVKGLTLEVTIAAPASELAGKNKENNP